MSTTIVDTLSSGSGSITTINYTSELDRIATALEKISNVVSASAIVTTSSTVTSVVATIIGRTLTIDTTVTNFTGTVVPGMLITGNGVVANTFIVSGSYPSWTVNNSQKVFLNTIFTITNCLNYYSNRMAVKVDQAVEDVDQITKNSTAMTSDIDTITSLASNSGIEVAFPWDWVGVATVLKAYQDEGLNILDFKNIVDRLPKK
jgi:hypothetical protein